MEQLYYGYVILFAFSFSFHLLEARPLYSHREGKKNPETARHCVRLPIIGSSSLSIIIFFCFAF